MELGSAVGHPGGQAGEMIDAVGMAHGLAHQALIANISDHQLDPAAGPGRARPALGTSL
jgi:hypothetical protein